MAKFFQPWLVFCIVFVFSYSLSQSNSQHKQNIEVFYPTTSLPSPLTPSFNETPGSPLIMPAKSSSSKNSVIKAAAITAATTLVVAGFFFFMIHRRSIARKNKKMGAAAVVARSGSSVARMPKFGGDLKGFIVDENGLDMVYWRKLEGVKYKNSYRKETLYNHHRLDHDHQERNESEIQEHDRGYDDDEIHEAPLLRGQSSSSEFPDPAYLTGAIPAKVMSRKKSFAAQAPPPPMAVMGIPKRENIAPPPPPPPPAPKMNTGPPPPPPPKSGMLPLPPPMKSNMPPPPPPLKPGMPPPPRPPMMPKKGSNEKNPFVETIQESEDVGQQVKMKPLHWDKVNAPASQSMVWHKLDGGSFNFDGDLMEALFGSVASNHKKSPTRERPSSSNSNAIPNSQQKIFILDSRKSQNIAIVLRSLKLSRQEILDGLTEGQGLSTDTLEKLTGIAPTQEEESQITSFKGDSTKLADAESFLFHLLKSVPFAFPRIESMFFRSNYVFEIIHFKESLQTLELACNELRTRGLFLKLLEAVLKSGNRMNAGTARGNAQAFNLTALKKLSDVKSTDGKTTLLHFVVEEVVRSEGRRCVSNKNNRSLARSNSRNAEITLTKDERESEYTKLGLPIVGGVSSQFTNVKKGAIIDYDGFVKTCAVLTTRLADIKKIVAQCAATKDGGGRFVREMGAFIESSETELKQLSVEQVKAMELIQKTTLYYQTGSLKEKDQAQPFQLFVIVKDFLGMVDQVCVDIARNLQRRKTVVSASSATATASSSTPKSAVRFPILPEHFMSDRSKSSSSDSSDDS